MKGNFLSEEFAEYPFDVTAYSPPSVSLLRMFLFYYYYYYVFFFHSPLAYTHTHTYIYILYITYPLCIPFIRGGGGGVHFLPATSKLEYILYYTHTLTRLARTLYIILSPTGRQIVRFSSPPRYSWLYNNIHALLKCSWHNLHQNTVQVDTVYTHHITVVAALQYNVLIYI